MLLNLRENLRNYFFSIWFLWTFSLVLNIITFLYIFYKIHPGNKTLALRYNILVGVEWYGEGKNLYLVPGIGLIVLIINFYLYKAFRDNKNFLAPLTVFVTICAELILLSSVLLLAKVN